MIQEKCKLTRIEGGLISINKLAELPTKRSDHDNGYYVQAAHWGTCFHRKATKWVDFHVYHNRQPSFLHTYTKVPLPAWERTYSLYCNYTPEVEPVIQIGEHDIIVGFDHPQPSACGRYLNRSFLVYSPEGTAPEIEYADATGEAVHDPEGFWEEKAEQRRWVNAASFFKGKAAQLIRLDEEGYQTNFKKEATFRIGELLQNQLHG